MTHYSLSITYFKVFLTGGIICTISQILIDKTKLKEILKEQNNINKGDFMKISEVEKEMEKLIDG